jgi:hypothetical protein
MKRLVFWLVARLLRRLWSANLPAAPGVYLHADAATQVLEVWRGEGGALLATRAGRPVAMEVARWAGWWIGPLPFGAGDLRSPRIAPEAFERLAGADRPEARAPASRGLWLLRQPCSRPGPAPSAGSSRDRLSGPCCSWAGSEAAPGADGKDEGARQAPAVDSARKGGTAA